MHEDRQDPPRPGPWPADIADQCGAMLAISSELVIDHNAILPVYRLENSRRPPLQLAKRLRSLEDHGPFPLVVLASSDSKLAPITEAWLARGCDHKMLAVTTEGVPAVDGVESDRLLAADISGLRGDGLVLRRGFCNWLRWVGCEQLLVADSRWGAVLVNEYRRPLHALMTVAAYIRDPENDERRADDFDVFLVDDVDSIAPLRRALGDSARIETLRDGLTDMNRGRA